MSYVDEIKQRVAEQNLAQPEFQQAVEEVKKQVGGNIQITEFISVFEMADALLSGKGRYFSLSGGTNAPLGHVDDPLHGDIILTVVNGTQIG